MSPRERKDGPALPPRATGIVLTAWVALMLLLAFVAVPLLFAQCTQAP